MLINVHCPSLNSIKSKYNKRVCFNLSQWFVMTVFLLTLCLCCYEINYLPVRSHSYSHAMYALFTRRCGVYNHLIVFLFF